MSVTCQLDVSYRRELAHLFAGLGFPVGLGFGVWGWGFQVSGFKLVSGFKFQVSGFRFQITGLGLQVGFGFRVSGARIRVSVTAFGWSLEFRV